MNNEKMKNVTTDSEPAKEMKKQPYVNGQSSTQLSYADVVKKGVDQE